MTCCSPSFLRVFHGNPLNSLSISKGEAIEIIYVRFKLARPRLVTKVSPESLVTYPSRAVPHKELQALAWT